jgi:hypothetical protein
MHRALGLAGLVGLACLALVIASGAFAADGAPASGTESSETTPHVKHVAPAKKRAPAPLSAAETAATGNADLPVTSGHAREPATGPSWTGFHVGIGGGVGSSGSK